jgi:hypothetical protein
MSMLDFLIPEEPAETGLPQDTSESPSAIIEIAAAMKSAQAERSKVGQVGSPIDLAPLVAIATRRAALEDELRDLYLQLDTAKEMLALGLWSPEHKRIFGELESRIDAKTLDWCATETEAWQAFFHAGQTLPSHRPAGWTPFQLIEGQP